MIGELCQGSKQTNLKSKARGEKGSLEEQHNQVLHRLVALVRFNPLSQVLHCKVMCKTRNTDRESIEMNYRDQILHEERTNAVIRVDLKVLLSGHIPHGGGVSQSLGLHDPFHVRSPTILERPSLIRKQ